MDVFIPSFFFFLITFFSLFDRQRKEASLHETCQWAMSCRVVPSSSTPIRTHDPRRKCDNTRKPSTCPTAERPFVLCSSIFDLIEK